MGTVNCRLECDNGSLPPMGGNEWEKCPELRCPYNRYGIAGKKVLSVIMPWPWLIMKFGKDVENRTWRTDYRGTILIHASKKPDLNCMDKLGNIIGKITEEAKEKWLEINRTWCGCIVGSVELVDCVQNHNSPWAEPGMWHWVLKNPVLLKEPIPARGSLGLWEFKEQGERKWKM